MEQDNFKVYGYRWIVLVAFMFIVAIIQLIWITFAPITGDATKYYHVSDLSIGLLSMSFMIVYIIVSIPASWVIDTYGIRVGVGIAAVLMAVFGLLRGVRSTSYACAARADRCRHRTTLRPQRDNHRRSPLVPRT
jgi:fucose permease